MSTQLQTASLTNPRTTPRAVTDGGSSFPRAFGTDESPSILFESSSGSRERLGQPWQAHCESPDSSRCREELPGMRTGPLDSIIDIRKFNAALAGWGR